MTRDHGVDNQIFNCACQFSPVMATPTPTSAVPPGSSRVNACETPLVKENICYALFQWEAMGLAPFIKIRCYQCDFSHSYFMAETLMRITKNSFLRLKRKARTPNPAVSYLSPPPVCFCIQFLCGFLCHLQNAALEKLRDKAKCKSLLLIPGL